jgi:hypothetical protein
MVDSFMTTPNSNKLVSHMTTLTTSLTQHHGEQHTKGGCAILDTSLWVIPSSTNNIHPHNINKLKISHETG